ncbi:protein dispatched homolog 1-like [Elysia marginata]|uniref:Protein dispatched homolog 1-like n=1 Tax=Elysia marginata TaxID=1093978 RepID=A0AAV4HLQ9_9GAST|nr:protein dispatched homolog 1-like [Elysia marginata]
MKKNSFFFTTVTVRRKLILFADCLGKFYGTRLRYAAVEITLDLLHSSVDYEEGLEIYDNWEKFAVEEIAKLPPSLQGGVQFTPGLNERNTWHEFKRQEALADSAVQGILIGICLAYVVLAFATMNVIIALMATSIILLVTISVSAFIPILGWEISVIESINLSLVVGLAVDYVVHLSEAYHTSPQKHRVDKVRDMLEHMGVSVISGAFSTLGAASFMMAAQIQFFLQFGVFLFLTIGFSLTYSLCLFTPLLSVIGPEGNTGSVLPLFRMLWYKIIGRKKDDVKCERCKGKGFHCPLASSPTDIEETPMHEIKYDNQSSPSPAIDQSPDEEMPTTTVVKL